MSHWPQLPHPATPNIVIDLGADLGSRRWWAGMATLLSLMIVATGLALSARPDWPNGAAEPTPHASIDAMTVAAPEPAAAPLDDGAGPATELQAAEAPEPTPAAANAETVITPGPLRQAHVLGSGDTLIALLLRAGADQIEAHRAVATLRDVFNPRKLRAGQEIWTEIQPASGTGPATVLQSLEFDMGFAERLRVARAADGGFVAERESLDVSRSWVSAEGMIDDSLYLAAERANVPAAAIVNLIRIFSFNVDFQRDIWPGDRFALTYELLENADGKTRLGEILFGELVLRGKPILLYRFTPGDGRTDYFDADGISARRLLMRTPVDGARLSSRFGKRKHPILDYTKMHSGIDFAAPTGTPIMAAGDGVIEFIGRNGGYGNMIRIRHNGTYKTAYAHMSRFKSGMGKGKRVRQGEIIGYVGSTGRSTGPHLHYEVFMHDQRVNPLSLELPTGKELAGADLEKFQAHRAEIDTARKAPYPTRIAASQAD
ncbi:MAG: hypothetical protein Tsb0016_09240 [Sphingomonadales bacterium]